MIDYDRLLEIAATTRTFIATSDNQAQALRDIIASHDVIFGIFPAEKNSWALHVVKGREFLSDQSSPHNHTVLPFQTREQAAQLEALVA